MEMSAGGNTLLWNKKSLLGKYIQGKTHVIMMYVIRINGFHKYLQGGLYTDNTRLHR
jgi:hypothetical protein